MYLRESKQGLSYPPIKLPHAQNTNTHHHANTIVQKLLNNNIRPQPFVHTIYKNGNIVNQS